VVATFALAIGVLGLTLTASGGAPQPQLPGLPGAGPVTDWGLPIARLLVYFTSMATLGPLVVTLLLPDQPWAVVLRRRLRGLSESWALSWAGASAISVPLAASDFYGEPVASLISRNFRLDELLGARTVVALILMASAAGLLAAFAGLARRRGQLVVLLLLGMTGLLPLALVGHSASGQRPLLGIVSLAIHIIAATVWVGGLLAITLHMRRDPDRLAAVVVPFSTVALACFVVTAVSGAVNAFLKLGWSLTNWGSPYGLVVVLKIAALCLLGVFGWWHRSRTLPLIVRRRSTRAYLVFAGAELMILAATVALAVALARTPLPT
jgi:putative copper resistance protein D